MNVIPSLPKVAKGMYLPIMRPLTEFLITIFRLDPHTSCVLNQDFSSFNNVIYQALKYFIFFFKMFGCLLLKNWHHIQITTPTQYRPSQLGLNRAKVQGQAIICMKVTYWTILHSKMAATFVSPYVLNVFCKGSTTLPTNHYTLRACVRACSSGQLAFRRPSLQWSSFLSSFMLVPSLLYRCDSFDLFT